MTVLKLSAFPAAFRANVPPLTGLRLRVAGRRPARKIISAKSSPRKGFSPRKARDANVALIMAVMMSLVFAPVVGMHLFATFGPADLGAAKSATGVVSRTVPALPPG